MTVNATQFFRVVTSRVLRIVNAQWLCLLAALFFQIYGSPSHAKEYIGASDRLSMMQKIQGTWRGKCVPGVGGMNMGYQQPTVLISYTQIKIKVDLYKTHECLHKKGEFTQVYLYQIGVPVALKSGEVAFELNLGLETTKAGGAPAVDALEWSKLNLISFNNGQLFFGRPRAIETNERLDYLDVKYPYVR